MHDLTKRIEKATENFTLKKSDQLVDQEIRKWLEEKAEEISIRCSYKPISPEHFKQHVKYVLLESQEERIKAITMKFLKDVEDIVEGGMFGKGGF